MQVIFVLTVLALFTAIAACVGVVVISWVNGNYPLAIVMAFITAILVALLLMIL